jgi:hypothetical protein
MAVEIPGIGSVTAEPPVREPIRVRGMTVTISAWRIVASSAQGPGTLVLAEQGGKSWYRGDGIFLGWPQERLAAAWKALLPAPEPSGDDFPQLG